MHRSGEHSMHQEDVTLGSARIADTQAPPPQNLSNDKSGSTLALDQVQSFEYLIGGNSGSANYWSLIGSSPVQLVITGGGAADNYATVNRAVADPNNNKLIFAYIETTEASSYAEPSLFANGTPNVSWIGKAVPGYSDLYTAQYWNPQWLTVIETQIKGIISAGYDGVFLDSLSDDNYWLPGNSLGNTANAAATQNLATLLDEIRAYVNSLNLPHPFYIIGNNPTSIAQQYPSSLKDLNGILNESVFWTQPASNGLTSVYNGTGGASYFQSSVAPIYAQSGALLLGNDYPLPLSNYAADFQSFAFYTALGVVPSVQAAYQTAQILSTGPFMFMANAASPVVTGTVGYENFLSGGLVANATLIGGDSGNYFIGGPGQNTIKGGGGTDIIYAHPASAGLENVLDFQFVNGASSGAPLPSIEILINGQIALNPTQITQTFSSSSFQDVQINTAQFGKISSIVIEGINIYYNNSSDFNNVFLESMSWQGQAVALNRATTNSGSSLENNGTTILFNQNGTANFSASALPSSTFLANTSDTIAGGTGTNTVVYRAASADYTIAHNSDGSMTVTALQTAEGPDTLTNIQHLQFTDGTEVVESAAAVSAELDSLQTLASANSLISVTATDAGFAALPATPAQLTSDAQALAKIGGNFYILIAADTTSETIAGVSGHGNIVAFSGTASQWTVTPSGNGTSFTVTNGTVTDTLSGVTALQFSDYTDFVASQTAASAGGVSSAQITNLYAAVFGRTPDVPGLAYYEAEAAANPSIPITAYAKSFLQSPEYTNNSAHNYAQTSAGDAQFITDTYSNLLHRAPGTGDVAWYQANVIDTILGGANPGTAAYTQAELQAHASVLADFSASSEFLNDVQITSQSKASTQHWLILI